MRDLKLLHKSQASVFVHVAAQDACASGEAASCVFVFLGTRKTVNSSTFLHIGNSANCSILCIRKLKKVATSEPESSQNLRQQIFGEHPNPASTMKGQPSLRQDTLHPSNFNSGSNCPSSGQGSWPCTLSQLTRTLISSKVF